MKTKLTVSTGVDVFDVEKERLQSPILYINSVMKRFFELFEKRHSFSIHKVAQYILDEMKID